MRRCWRGGARGVRRNVEDLRGIADGGAASVDVLVQRSLPARLLRKMGCHNSGTATVGSSDNHRRSRLRHSPHLRAWPPCPPRGHFPNCWHNTVGCWCSAWGKGLVILVVPRKGKEFASVVDFILAQTAASERAICHAFEQLALGSGISAAAAAAAAEEAAAAGGGDGGVLVELVDKGAADGPPTTILRRFLGLHLRARTESRKGLLVDILEVAKVWSV